MIDLQSHEHDALRQVVEAGANGVELAEVGVAMAIRLALEEFVRITKDEPQRVIATSKGAAHSRRGVFA